MKKDPGHPINHEAVMAEVTELVQQAFESSGQELAEVADFARRNPSAEQYPAYQFKLGEVTGARDILGRIGIILQQAGEQGIDEQWKHLQDDSAES